MSDNYQICFRAKGLLAPEKGVSFGNFLIEGTSESDDAAFFFKIPLRPNSIDDPLVSKLQNFLSDFSRIYALYTNDFVKFESGYSTAPLSSECPLGDKRLLTSIDEISIFDESERLKNVSNIEKTTQKYECIKTKLEGKASRSLRNSIDYYYRSLDDKRLEEKLIDLMIALESSLNASTDLTLRYSLRAAFLLGVGQETQRPTIFKNIIDLYGKRSGIVHGGEKVRLDYSEVSIFQKYVRETIRRLIQIDLPHKNFLALLDEAVYDDNKRQELNKIVTEAINKW